ncbi:MAG TPA: HlyD family efflux transporter periplasmic adaptor subunit [Clostridia bacterium]|nr:HlyD family efflux transporter periplasmic adaptor subunit [Clostridia bacterium]
MRKVIATALLIALTIPLAAAAQDEAEAYRPKLITLEGSVVAGASEPVLAPFGGVVTKVHALPNDIVWPGDWLYEIGSAKVYAPCDGVVGSLRAQVGDDAGAVQDRYGALLYIEPAGDFIIKTNTAYAFASAENKLIHVGETVYISSRDSKERFGQGFVTSVDGSNYTVEVTGGNLILNDKISIFRSGDYAAESKIGSGTTARNALVPVTAEGGIFKLYANQGDAVRKGDLLLETVEGSLHYGESPASQVVAGYTSVVASMNAAAGDKVAQGQTMAVLYPMSSLCVVVNASESDLRDIRLGDGVTVECASLASGQTFEGTIRAISGQSVPVGEQVCFPVTIAFDPRADLRIGMSVEVYFNQ